MFIYLFLHQAQALRRKLATDAPTVESWKSPIKTGTKWQFYRALLQENTPPLFRPAARVSM
jgi:hypothetical protein